jgi:hypothetical protein
MGTHAELMQLADGHYRKSYDLEAANFAHAETAVAAAVPPTPLTASASSA